MKKYIATDKVFEGTTNPAKVFQLLAAAGENGLTRDELAAQATGMAPTGIYTYLYTLAKGGHIRTLETGTPRTGSTIPAGCDTEPIFIVKWQCPSCRKWVKEEISKRCSSCSLTFVAEQSDNTLGG